MRPQTPTERSPDMKGDRIYELPTAEQLKNEMDRLRYKRSYIRTLTGTIGALIAAAAAIVLLSVLVFPVMRVTGNSMQPTLKEDQVIMCRRSAHVKQGDIIAFYHNKKTRKARYRRFGRYCGHRRRRQSHRQQHHSQ